jgi:hypothetical protein
MIHWPRWYVWPLALLWLLAVALLTLTPRLGSRPTTPTPAAPPAVSVLLGTVAGVNHAPPVDTRERLELSELLGGTAAPVYASRLGLRVR